jgi:hypothetical protein
MRLIRSELVNPRSHPELIAATKVVLYSEDICIKQSHQNILSHQIGLLVATIVKILHSLPRGEKSLEEEIVPRENEDLHGYLTRVHNFGKACQVEWRKTKKASAEDNTHLCSKKIYN